jgi:hypothetical protein
LKSIAHVKVLFVLIVRRLNIKKTDGQSSLLKGTST